MSLTIFENYTPSIRAIENPIFPHSGKKWKFIIEYHTISEDESQTGVAIPSVVSYDEYTDAIQDAYGIVEILGFRLTETFETAKIAILKWNPENKSYVEDYVIFDGRDFYPYTEDDE